MDGWWEARVMYGASWRKELMAYLGELGAEGQKEGNSRDVSV